MISSIRTIDDVRLFAKTLVAEGVYFHPDGNFSNYVRIGTAKPTYSDEESETRDALMNQCFQVCEQENLCIYETMGTAANHEREKLGLFFIESRQ